jgi:hypothetical protein
MLMAKRIPTKNMVITENIWPHVRKVNLFLRLIKHHPLKMYVRLEV